MPTSQTDADARAMVAAYSRWYHRIEVRPGLITPGINDSPEQVERILDLCAEAGATSVGGICLHLRGEVREVFMDWLRSHRPDLVPRYEQLYAGGAYATKAERERMSRLVRSGGRFGPPRLGPPRREKPVAPRHEQASLF